MFQLSLILLFVTVCHICNFLSYYGFFNDKESNSFVKEKMVFGSCKGTKETSHLGFIFTWEKEVNFRGEKIKFYKPWF